MTTTHAEHPDTIEPTAVHWRPTVPLPWESELRIAAVNAPLTAGERWHTVLDAQLYLIAGYDPTTGHVTGYFGQSTAINPGRPYDSLTHWTIQERRFVARRVGLVTFQRPPTPGQVRLIESRTLMSLSAAGIHLLNTQTSAGLASARLTRAERIQALRYADTLAEALHKHVLEGRANTSLLPAPNTREASVRVVLAATRALNTDEVCDQLIANGWQTTGRTFPYSVRRDLRARERETCGTPRVFTTIHRHRRVYWSPAIGKTAALAAYDAAHALPARPLNLPEAPAARHGAA